MLNYLEHPEEEVLERFVLHQSGEEETEVVETHILACDSCVSRLEALEVEVAAMKLALQEIRKNEAVADVAARQKASGRNWFSLPKLSMAAGVAALALGLVVIPQLRNGTGVLPVAQVSLVANRGSEFTVVPKGRPLHVVLNANDLNEKQLEVRLVDANGTELWKGSIAVQQNRASVDLPKIDSTGEDYVRLYAPTTQGEPELLREFPLTVR
jgi:anti-sigma factor RsiW